MSACFVGVCVSASVSVCVLVCVNLVQQHSARPQAPLFRPTDLYTLECGSEEASHSSIIPVLSALAVVPQVATTHCDFYQTLPFMDPDSRLDIRLVALRVLVH